MKHEKSAVEDFVGPGMAANPNTDGKAALEDIVSSFQSLPLAAVLAFEDLRDRFRRSFIGLGWIVASFLLFLVVKSVIFSGVFAAPEYDYTTHLSIGFAAWIFINGAVIASGTLFTRFAGYILSTPMPLALYAHIMVFTVLFEFIIVFLTALIFCIIFASPNPLGVIFTPVVLLIYVINAFALALLLGTLGAWRRDIFYAVQSVMRILFFATPILWVATPGTVRADIAFWNPFTYYIDIIRDPFLGLAFPWHSFGVVLIFTTLLCAGGAWAFVKSKTKVPVWL